MKVLKDILAKFRAGASTPGAAAPAMELRAAEQGAVSEATVTC